MTSPTSIATLHTNHGAINVNLFGLHAPKTVDNFEGLATGAIEWRDPKTNSTQTNTPLYSGVIFHRIIPDFMIQGGDPTGTGMGGPGYQFGDEIHSELTFSEPYMFAMATPVLAPTDRNFSSPSPQPLGCRVATPSSARSQMKLAAR